MELLGALLFLIKCLSVTYGFQSGVDYDGVLNVKLRHALDHVPSPEFTDRGAITIQSIRTGAVSLQQVALSAFDRQKLKHLAEEDGLYRLNATVRTVDGKEISFLTFVKACSLVESGLSDILTVSLDHAGMPVAVTANTISDGCHGDLEIVEDLRNFNTSVFVKHMELGPVPDTATYIQKLEKEKEARERGETQDNRSFLAKYWMYIVPVVIFVLLSGAANPEGAAGGGAGGGGGGGGGAGR